MIFFFNYRIRNLWHKRAPSSLACCSGCSSSFHRVGCRRCQTLLRWLRERWRWGSWWRRYFTAATTASSPVCTLLYCVICSGRDRMLFLFLYSGDCCKLGLSLGFIHCRLLLRRGWINSWSFLRLVSSRCCCCCWKLGRSSRLMKTMLFLHIARLIVLGESSSSSHSSCCSSSAPFLRSESCLLNLLLSFL